MSYPLQDRNIQTNRKAKAPYNFVRLPEHVAQVEVGDLPDQDCYYPERLHGSIACNLNTLTPIFIRAGMTRDQYEVDIETRKNADFFYWNNRNQPVIPGSSLRGLFRSAIEIISFSKVEPVANMRFTYRSVGDTTSHGKYYRNALLEEVTPNREYRPKMKAGYLHRNGREWYIQPAEDTGQGMNWARVNFDEHPIDDIRTPYLQQTHNNFRAYVRLGKRAFYEVSQGSPFMLEYIPVDDILPALETAHESGYHEAVLVRSGRMNHKHHEVVMMLEDRDAAPVVVDYELIRLYREQVLADHKKLVGNNGLLEDGQPVFYLENPRDSQQALFFGNCMMFRLPYAYRVLDFIPQELHGGKNLDMAEALFGYTREGGEGKARAYAGRLFFSSGELQNSSAQIWEGNPDGFWLRVLSEPKPTSFQHYLVQTQANPQPTGETDNHGNERTELHLTDYNAQPGEETVIRGHKMYWHKGKVEQRHLEEQVNEETDKIHSKVRPIRAGVKFTFRIHFENLSRRELGALIWVLNVAGDDQHYLKLGMGKPYGMGAVEIKIKDILLENKRERYQRLFSDHENWLQVFDKKEKALQTCNESFQMFESFVLEGIGAPQEIDQLDKHARIQDYLTMLRWPGPDGEDYPGFEESQTRYFEIQHPNPQARHGTENEYSKRKVLPRPKDV